MRCFMAVRLSGGKIDKRHSPISCTKTSPFQVSLAGRQLIHALLNRDPASHLGSNSGANDVKQHPFFCGINWPLIRCMSPPPLDVPLQLIGKDPKAKDLLWEDEGVPVYSMEFF